MQDSNLLFQYELDVVDIPSTRKEIWSGDTINDLFAGQLELGPDGNIYMSCLFGFSLPNNTFNPYNQYLGVIHEPDSLGLACDFRPFSFYLGDSARSYYSLPNMPNYNLGPAGVFAAQAAAQDTLLLCDTATAGIQLGTIPVLDMIYSWQPATGLSNTATAQPMASPTKSLWYTLTVTDTSQSNISCKVAVDSVYVEVIECVTSIEEPTQHDKTYILQPNLIKGEMSARLVLGTEEVGQVQIFGINGQHIRSYRVTEGVNDLAIGKLGLSGGVYFYQIWVNDEMKHGGKLVIIK